METKFSEFFFASSFPFIIILLCVCVRTFKHTRLFFFSSLLVSMYLIRFMIYSVNSNFCFVSPKSNKLMNKLQVNHIAVTGFFFHRRLRCFCPALFLSSQRGVEEPSPCSKKIKATKCQRNVILKSVWEFICAFQQKWVKNVKTQNCPKIMSKEWKRLNMQIFV